MLAVRASRASADELPRRRLPMRLPAGEERVRGLTRPYAFTGVADYDTTKSFDGAQCSRAAFKTDAGASKVSGVAFALELGDTMYREKRGSPVSLEIPLRV